MPALESFDVAARLGSAVLVGAILGINRDLHHKAAGLRTHALVSLGSAVVVVVITVSTPGLEANALSRVIQGLVTGVGFIGAGVILHHGAEHRVAGLTTAASIWLTAALGVACGSGSWMIAWFALALTIAVLELGGPIERALERRFQSRVHSDSSDSSAQGH
jgi:putative Mg2+ transporter-C (MgtC) family protein